MLPEVLITTCEDLLITMSINISFLTPRLLGRSARPKLTNPVHKAGLQDFRFHDLRHTAATRMAEAGASAFTLILAAT